MKSGRNETVVSWQAAKLPGSTRTCRASNSSVVQSSSIPTMTCRFCIDRPPASRATRFVLVSGTGDQTPRRTPLDRLQCGSTSQFPKIRLVLQLLDASQRELVTLQSGTEYFNGEWSYFWRPCSPTFVAPQFVGAAMVLVLPSIRPLSGCLAVSLPGYVLRRRPLTRSM